MLVSALLEKEQKGLVRVKRTIFLILYYRIWSVNIALTLRFETEEVWFGIKIEGILQFPI